MKVGVSGLVDEATGIGVYQRKLYPRLLDAFDMELQVLPTRDRGKSPSDRALGLMVGLFGRVSAPVVFSVVPPLPIATPRRAAVVSVIHDLRWHRTRSRASRWYRTADLLHTLARSDRVIVISQRTRDDVAAKYPRYAPKLVVVHPGPGIVDKSSCESRELTTALLIGAATHKRNELAARLLSEKALPDVREVVSVGVSPATKAILDAAPHLRHHAHSRVTEDELRALYASSGYYLHLGVEEGFGLPYVEAMASGCQVVAIDQPLTREVLGDAAMLVRDDDIVSMRDQLQAMQPTTSATRRSRLSRYDWDICAGAVAGLISAVSESKKR